VSQGNHLYQEEKTWGTLLVHTGVDGMWKNSTGAISSSWGTRKKGLSILSCFKDFEFGFGDVTMEIPRVASVSQGMP
jgi:hypothetical protein